MLKTIPQFPKSKGRLVGDSHGAATALKPKGSQTPSSASFASFASPDPPKELDQDAYYGLAGDIVRAIDPHTESDPAALLLQLLVAFGNVVGRGPYYQVEADQHTMNLFVVLVGNTSKSRKGTSWGHIRALLEAVDPDWATRITSGLSSGEGLIFAVRDPIEELRPIEEATNGPKES